MEKDVSYYIDQIVDLAIMYAPKLALAIITLLVGLWVVGMITRTFKKVLHKREADPSLIPFLSGMVNIILKVMLVISVIGMVGIQTTSFIAVLGAAGLAVGMALSGTLQNFAGGVIILILKPFKVGDFIEGLGHSGTVSEIQIFNTILKTPDNKTIILPNGNLSTSAMINYSTEPKRRVDMSFGIGYGNDFNKAKDVLMKIIEADKRILNDPAEPFIQLGELADSSVNLVVRVWVNSSDYWGVHFDLKRIVYEEFDKADLEIPFPQMDVHIHQSN